MSKKVKVLVETISMFKLSYIVELDGTDNQATISGAKDLVVGTENKEEINQEWLDEVIVGARILSKNEYQVLCDVAMNGHVADRLIIRD